MSYVSGRTAMNENSPDSLVCPVMSGSLPPGRKTLTVASGIDAPVWSTTLPLRRPATWAFRAATANRAARKHKATFERMKILSLGPVLESVNGTVFQVPCKGEIGDRPV